MTTEAEARELAHGALRATGYPIPELEIEKLEHGFKLFAGDDIGAVRLTLDNAALHRVHLEVLKMWWRREEAPLQSALDYLFRGQPSDRPGGHMLWTTVLQARSMLELEPMLLHAGEMREAMLRKARRRGLQPSRCRLFHYFGHRLSGEGESADGTQWEAEVLHGRIRRFSDSAPLWKKVKRLVSRPKGDQPSGEPAAIEGAPGATPISAAPAIVSPAVEAPVAEAPVSEVPVSEAPISEAPVSEAPVSEAPVAEAPVSDAPAIESPSVEIASVAVASAESPAEVTPVETPAVEAQDVDSQDSQSDEVGLNAPPSK